MNSKSPILPLHQNQRYANGVPLGYNRTGLRASERYVVYLLFLVFMSVCYSAVFLVPELRGRVNSFVDSPEQLFKPGGDETFPGHQHRGGENGGNDVHVEQDRRRIELQIAQDRALEEARLALQQGNNEPNAGKDDGVDPDRHHEDSDKLKDEIKQDKMKFIEDQKKQMEDDLQAARKSGMEAIAAKGFIDRTDGEPTDSDVKSKRDHIREMMLHAWNGYVTYAWGANELKPIARTGHSASIFGRSAMGATIIDGIDTLFMMGLRDEYQKARDWVAHDFKFDASSDVSVFETNIRFVGGLLSIYALTHDEVFKEKAVGIADKLLPAFNTPTGIPFGLVNIKTGSARNWGWASGGSSILSEFGSLHLEFAYLSEITGDPKYQQKVDKIREVLKDVKRPDGLYPNYLNPKTGKWGQMHVSLGALGDSFYEYLLKSYIMTGGKDEEGKHMYFAAIEAMEGRMKQKSGGSLTYFGDIRANRIDKKMDHLSCFSGGMFALGSKYSDGTKREHYMDLGKEITKTCHRSYDNTATKLGPEAFRFEGRAEAVAMRQNEKYYILRPETIESYFVLFRATGDPIYRQWGWEAAQAIENHCRVANGYSGIKDVYASTVTHDDVQQSFFLAETLKYLYLLFSDEEFFSLDDWVLNTEAHPLPVTKS
ncbi:mannosyl-oligosaccharide 1,2-alpha-mannosidase IA-like [Diadema setosum]|uniref:mannosyl-oligosaccharide 1,2-alpha-mannosidase IA-like n=1 Tax=Diadema setosum TaxID=31175 RepID=UPI003B3A6C1C